MRVKSPMGLERFQVGKLEFEKKYRSNDPGPGGSPIKKCFGTIKGLPIGFNSTKGILALSKLTWVYSYIFRFEARKKSSVFS